MSLDCIVLAAGMGTRMKSARPKVLHEAAGISLIGHVLAATRAIGADRVCVVVGPDMDSVAAEARRAAPLDYARHYGKFRVGKNRYLNCR